MLRECMANNKALEEMAKFFKDKIEYCIKCNNQLPKEYPANLCRKCLKERTSFRRYIEEKRRCVDCNGLMSDERVEDVCPTCLAKAIALCAARNK